MCFITNKLAKVLLNFASFATFSYQLRVTNSFSNVIYPLNLLRAGKSDRGRVKIVGHSRDYEEQDQAFVDFLLKKVQPLTIR